MCCDYHQPVVLAKEFATIEMLSEGRLEAGYGAGWVKSEYEAMGVPWDRAGIRIDRMVEHVTMARAAFTGEAMAFSGDHVTAVDFSAVPASPRPKGPPIMIGGGSPRVLGLAGQLADIVSVNFDNSDAKIGAVGVGSGTADGTAQKIDWIRAGAGDRFDDIEIEIGGYFTIVTDDAETAAGQMSGMLGLPPEELMTHPHCLIGSVDAICDTLEARRETYGISYVTVGATALDAFAPSSSDSRANDHTLHRTTPRRNNPWLISAPAISAARSPSSPARRAASVAASPAPSARRAPRCT